MSTTAYAYEIPGGVQVCKPQDGGLETYPVFVGDDEWPGAFALLVETKKQALNDD